jgi:hypothetical protein
MKDDFMGLAEIALSKITNFNQVYNESVELKKGMENLIRVASDSFFSEDRHSLFPVAGD